MSILWGAAETARSIAKALQQQIRDREERRRIFMNTSVPGGQKLNAIKLTEEQKRKLSAKIAEQQGKEIERAEAQGLKYAAAKQRADRQYPRESKSQVKELSAEEKRSLQAKILEHSRQQFEKKKRRI